MNKREQRRPLIVESWDGDDPLDAFALERPNTSNQPALPVTPSVDDRDVAIDFNEPRSARATRRSAGAVMGVAGLVVVAAAAVGMLSIFVSGSRSSEDVTTIANRSDSDAPAQVGSAGRLADREVVPEAIDLSPRAPEPPGPDLIQRSAPVSVPPPAPPVRPIVANPTPPPSGTTSPSPGAVTGTPPSATNTAPSGAAAAPPPSAVMPTPPGIVTVVPNVAPAPPPATVTAPPAPTVATAAPSSAVNAASASVVAAAPPIAVAAASPGATAQSAVTAVLQRYAAAFGALDVRAAKAVWPQVNQDALTRAFSALQEQKFDLGNCDIWVTGASAVASCAGRATYTPKVGNRKQRSEAREWTFYLDQDDQRWSIATVRIR